MKFLEHLEKLLTASVKSRMNADVPLEFFEWWSGLKPFSCIGK